MGDLLHSIAATAELSSAPDQLHKDSGSQLPRDAELRVVGYSRSRRAIHAFRMGTGSVRVSLIAGAHADEPVGPAALTALTRWLVSAPEAVPLLRKATFCICPHVNPDGAHQNAGWIDTYPCPIEVYGKDVRREAPGDDVEFGFPEPGGRKPRPENAAVAAFLRANGPFDFHASLHGMAIAEGAWFLVNREKLDVTAGLRSDLTTVVRALGMPLHDWDRCGEKGFTRIAPGFSTTPTVNAMREHFMKEGDAATARQFLPSSMDYVRSLGGDPLCVVSEIPLYEVTPSAPGARPLGRNFLEAMELLSELRGEDTAQRSLTAMRERFGLAPVPVESAVKLQLALVFLGSGLCSLKDLQAAATL